MTVFVKSDRMPGGLCWKCHMPLSSDTSVVMWDSLYPILLHSRCAFEKGKELVHDGNEALSIDIQHIFDDEIDNKCNSPSKGWNNRAT